MLGFSDNGWKGFGFYYRILNTLHYTKLVAWDPTKKYLCKTTKPQYTLWNLSLGCAILISFFIPGFIFLEFVYTGYNPSRNFSYEKLFVLLTYLLAGVHAIPTSFKLYKSYPDTIVGFNLYMRLQRHVQGIMKKPARAEKPLKAGVKFEPSTIVVTALGPTLLVFSTGSIIFVMRQTDPSSYFIQPDLQYNWLLIVFRLAINFLGLLEMMTTLGIAHPTFFAIGIHASSIVHHLPFYNLKRRHGFKSKDEALNRAADVMIYKTYAVAFSITKSYLDVALWCALLAGVAFGVVGNYTVIKLYQKLPIPVYMYGVLISLLVPLIMGTLFPLGAKSYESSVQLLKGWESGAKIRRRLQHKTVKALKPLGFSVGGFFVFQRESTASIYEQLINFTVDAILSL